VTAWQQRPLEACYAVVLFDCLRVKIRDEGTVRSKAVYVALGVTRGGAKEVLGLWIEQTEGAKFWHRVMTELQARGVHDILIALIDGLTGFPEAIGAVFPQTQIHTGIVHLVRRSLAFVGWQDRKRVAGALRRIYRAETVAAAEAALQAFAASADGARYPLIAPIWQRAWADVTPAFASPPGDPPNLEHDERDREPAHAAAEDHQDPGPLSDGRSRAQAAVLSASEHSAALGAVARVARGAPPSCHPVR
jgi:putative transposase